MRQGGGPAADKTGIIFKVQMGAFKLDVPINTVNQFLDLVTGNVLEHGLNDQGLTIYTAGKFTDYKSANDFKTLLVSKGIADAFVIAFQHGKKIDLNIAIELLK